MRLIFDENTGNEVAKLKDYVKDNKAVLIVDKCSEQKILHRIMIHGDYNPFSPQEMKMKQKMPKFEIRSIKYENKESEVEAKSFLTFEEAYAFFISLITLL